MKKIYFERAIFISWYCSKRDYAFCYLSSKKGTQDPKKDRRSLSSILAEGIICKAQNWKVEFLSGGCDTYNDKELLKIIKNVYKITEQKQWLNVGVLSEKQLRLFKPYIEGVCGAVECINFDLRDKLCPSKPLDEIYEMFKICDKLRLKKSITIIIGLGETIKDFQNLKKFIEKNKVDRVTFYRLKPQKGTIFEGKKGPETKNYVEWIKKTRQNFPKLEIIAGSWLTHLDEIHLLLKAGADGITKFPAIKLFNSKYANKIKNEVEKAGMKFESNFIKIDKIKIDGILDKLEEKEKIKSYLKKYINHCMLLFIIRI